MWVLDPIQIDPIQIKVHQLKQIYWKQYLNLISQIGNHC